MKAAILVKQKAPLEIGEIELPGFLEYGQVLVRVIFSSICGAQINEIDGTKGEDKFLPHLLGHEGSGVVEDTGSGVTRVKKGDRVIMHWRQGSGIQSPTPSYLWGGKKVNAGWVTTFNEYAVVSENRLTPVAEDTDLKTAVLYGCALTTGFGVVHHDSKLKSGESAVIFGAGGAGCGIIMMAKLVNANPIVAVDINKFKLGKASAYGATHTFINSSRIRQDLEKIIGRQGADVTIDTTGINSIRELAYESASSAGRTILVGVPKKGEKMAIDSFPLHFDKVLTGSFGGDVNPGLVIPKLMNLQKLGIYNPQGMITKTYPLAKVNEAISEVRNGDVIRVAIRL
ncbi:MAG: zinc-containing alcohol dehydrogenase superfamily protein, S-(hydroxymethyl)glutathione dehydrogenase / alcohol dehydrogenase [Candidatus Gottesmanbacteria bacterium GW2011_GWA2_43_14]|uniref:Zinc-containing alcohol dehydrogenase superfamily protein, S-(Hydroxymethyl)glutathione dehydrogenase / alcohol dehydrogenase n=1 Tax=Candidatus Gottesmanbacteria bacterium GW2011_GWA2_43_14 TaxID=1618443 RepID=A0A0G1FRZ5_9BACT|nr:MAG: zinc-containing alcohol dehydrogenase superfamily protein, S-(hydroxymethyl)glutathione dehydrogenase / alcohol dehydrogenase [Candidatus Gottesmanbacteria bacterium GW2011_GWA2_43_14]